MACIEIEKLDSVSDCVIEKQQDILPIDGWKAALHHHLELNPFTVQLPCCFHERAHSQHPTDLPDELVQAIDMHGTEDKESRKGDRFADDSRDGGVGIIIDDEVELGCQYDDREEDDAWNRY